MCTVYCKLFEVEKFCGFCRLISNHKTFPVKCDNAPIQQGLATQDCHTIANVFQWITVHFCNCKTFPSQTIYNKWYVYLISRIQLNVDRLVHIRYSTEKLCTSNKLWSQVWNLSYVTGFGKTSHLRTKINIEKYIIPLFKV